MLHVHDLLSFHSQGLLHVQDEMESVEAEEFAFTYAEVLKEYARLKFDGQYPVVSEMAVLKYCSFVAELLRTNAKPFAGCGGRATTVHIIHQCLGRRRLRQCLQAVQQA